MQRGARGFGYFLALAFALAGSCGAPPVVHAPAPSSAASHEPAPGKYLRAEAIDLRQLLPDPPAQGSAISRAEVELVLALETDASASARARAIGEDQLTPGVFADALGLGKVSLAAAGRTHTAALLDQAEADTRAITALSKQLWARPRPPQQDPRVQAWAELPTSASYPSGHATRATVWSRILALLVPERAEDIAARARLVASDRVIAGVHFPSDVVAGIALGNAIADRMELSPEFRRDLEAARAEWSR